MNSSETSSKLSYMNSSETSSKTHSPFKNASPRFRWHGAHLRVCRLRDTLDTWVRPRGEQRQAKPAGCKHSAIQPVTQPRTQRDTERSPTAFTHLPTCIMLHSPTCILALYLQTVRGTRCNTARSSIHITYTLHTHYIHITLYLQTCEGLGVTRAQLHTHYIIFADLRRDLCN